MDDGQVAEGLGDAELAAFAEVFHERAAATALLEQVGFPATIVPFDAPTALLFWSAVSRSLRAGVLAGGRAALLATAHTLFPYNATFAAGLGLPGTARFPSGPAPVVRLLGGPVVWNLSGPLPRFLGREDQLAEMHAKLTGAARVAPVVLDGMGGVGKSSLALEYAHRYAAELDLAWWVPAERLDLIGQNLTGLAEPLGLPTSASPGAVWAALRLVSSWLVIFDSAEDVDALTSFTPWPGGRVLVTSRRRAARRLGPAVPVPPFERTVSLDLLRDRVPSIDPVAANRVAELVGDLPLALDQVASFLDETDTPAAEYADLLAERPESWVVGLWNLSVDRLRAEYPAAAELLELCAWCAPDPIPLDLFTAHPGQLADGALAAAVADRQAWTATVGAVVGYSLARRDGDTLVVHRLVAADIRHTAEAESGHTGLAQMAGLLRAALPEGQPENPPGRQTWRNLLPHALAVADRARHTPGPGFDDGGWLADGAATYLQERGQLAAAVVLLERTSADREQVLGVDHPHTLLSRNNLAVAYESMGLFEQAIVLFERTLADRERVLGVDHPDTLLSRNNLAVAYQWASRFETALALFERTLVDRERVLGSDHPDTLMSRNSLAFAFASVGRVDEAISLFERTLADRERVLGADHPEISMSRHNLAVVYESVGRSEQAVVLFERTLVDRERVLGVDHPETLVSRNNLAITYESVGNVDRAIDLFERTLADRERVLGADHADTAVSRNNLARAYEKVGRTGEPAYSAGTGGPRPGVSRSPSTPKRPAPPGDGLNNNQHGGQQPEGARKQPLQSPRTSSMIGPTSQAQVADAGPDR